MNAISVGTRSARGTEAVGRAIGASLVVGDLVVLDGPLGAGKTTLTRGIASGLGVQGAVTSPTFVIARRHEPVPGGSAALVHVDAYRLGSAWEIDDLDLDSDLAGAAIVAEWGRGQVEALSESHLLVTLEPESNMERASGFGNAAGAPEGGTGMPEPMEPPRQITLVGHGARWPAERVDRLRLAIEDELVAGR